MDMIRLHTLPKILPMIAAAMFWISDAGASDPHHPPAQASATGHEPASPQSHGSARGDAPTAAEEPVHTPAHNTGTGGPLALTPAAQPLKTETPVPPSLGGQDHGAAPSSVPTSAPSSYPAPTHTSHWGYEGDGGPEHWGDMKPEFRTCSAGRSQSPIDIDTAGAAHMAPLAFHYKVSVVDMVNNGHTVQANYGKGSYITVGNDRYELVQFHFHTPSEHRVAGRSFPMEIHFVHKNAQGQLAVVGVLVGPGENNLAARELWDRLPAEPDTNPETAKALMNARDLLPDDARYFRYSGSLTTPPCSEQVSWFVLQTPIQFSIEQLGHIRGIMGANARPVQARNGRFLLQAIDGGAS